MAEDKEVKRLNYFKGLFLQEEDFNAEQAYHIRMRRLHNRTLHTWGVVEGLVVSQGSSTNSVVVSSGIAIDNLGQEIVLLPGSPSISTGIAKGDVFITVSYAEVDDPSDKYTTAGVENKFKKKTERPLLKAEAAAPAAGSLAVLLARVSVENSLVTTISNEVRRLANSALFSSLDLEVRSLKWGNNSRLQTDQGGSIELGGDPNTPGTPYIDFHFGPKAAEDFNVRLINDANGTLSIQGKVLQVTGSAGIGTPTPGARLTIQQGSTPAGSAANGKGLFVSALMGTGAASDGGIEFRHDNLTQGIGFGYNTIYATGSNANQDLAIQSRGTGSVLLNPTSGNVGIGSASAPRARLQVTGGAIMPAAGNSETSGIMFPKDPGGGSGDAAWIRYYARTGEPSTENTTLEIGTSNDPQDHIALMASGNVGVGTVNPTKKLTVSTSAASPDGVVVVGSDNHFALTAPSLGQGSFNGITRAGDAGIIYSGGTPGTGALVIAPWADAVSGLRLDANGNIGIGTATPQRRLQVGEDVNGLGIDPSDVSPNAAYMRFGDNTGWKLHFARSRERSGAVLNSGQAGILMTLKDDGNIGIGTTSPGARLQVTGGAIMPAAGATEASGLLFPKDPGGGGGDAAWIRYYARTGAAEGGSLENTTFEIGTSNDPQDHIAFMPSGNVGIGTSTPDSKLHVKVPASSTPIAAMSVDVDSFGTGPNSQASFFFRVRDIGAGPSTPFFIRGDGNVGIGSVNPQAKLEVAGSIRSTMWNVTQVLNQRPGALPINGAFTSGGGTLLIFASGSGYLPINTTGGIGMAIQIDNVQRGTAIGYTNEPLSHKAFVANALLVTGVAAGSHSLGLVAAPGFPTATVTDSNDKFSVTIMELPWATTSPFVVFVPSDVNRVVA